MHDKIFPMALIEARLIFVEAILYKNGFMHSDNRKQM